MDIRTVPGTFGYIKMNIQCTRSTEYFDFLFLFQQNKNIASRYDTIQ